MYSVSNKELTKNNIKSEKRDFQIAFKMTETKSVQLKKNIFIYFEVQFFYFKSMKDTSTAFTTTTTNLHLILIESITEC